MPVLSPPTHRQHFRRRQTTASSPPAVAIQAAILDGFGDVLGTDRLHAREVGDGARHFEYAIVAAGLRHNRPIAASSNWRPPVSNRQYVRRCWEHVRIAEQPICRVALLLQGAGRMAPGAVVARDSSGDADARSRYCTGGTST